MRNNFYIFLMSCLVFTGANAQVALFPQSTYEEMVIKARTLHKPFMIVLGYEDCTDCTDLYNKTLTNDALMEYVNEQLTIYSCDALSPTEQGLGLAQMLQVFEFPAVLVFSESGMKTGRINGFLPVKEFRTALEQIVSQTPTTDEIPAAFVDVNGPIVSTPKRTEEEYVSIQNTIFRNKKAVERTEEVEEMDGLVTTSKENATLTLADWNAYYEDQKSEELIAKTATFSAVTQFAKYAIKDKNITGFSLRVHHSITLDGFSKEIEVYERRWMKEKYVYKQERNAATVYCLALGKYDTEEDVLYMKKMLLNTFMIDAKVIKLENIVKGK